MSRCISPPLAYFFADTLLPFSLRLADIYGARGDFRIGRMHVSGFLRRSQITHATLARERGGFIARH